MGLGEFFNDSVKGPNLPPELQDLLKEVGKKAEQVLSQPKDAGEARQQDVYNSFIREHESVENWLINALPDRAHPYVAAMVQSSVETIRSTNKKEIPAILAYASTVYARILLAEMASSLQASNVGMTLKSLALSREIMQNMPDDTIGDMIATIIACFSVASSVLGELSAIYEGERLAEGE